MEVIAITSSASDEEEVVRIIELFEHGLDTLHLRKPKMPVEDVESIIESIPKRYHSNIIIHGKYHLANKYKLKGVHLKRKHRSSSLKNKWLRFRLKIRNPKLVFTTTFHSMHSLKENKSKFEYVFLSNVFSVNSQFNFEDSGLRLIRSIISGSEQKVYAIGGIEKSIIEQIIDADFHGAGLSSIVFDGDLNHALHQLEAFKAA